MTSTSTEQATCSSSLSLTLAEPSFFFCVQPALPLPFRTFGEELDQVQNSKRVPKTKFENTFFDGLLYILCARLGGPDKVAPQVVSMMLDRQRWS